MTNPTTVEPTLEPDFNLTQVAKALGMSPRWVRDRIRAGNEGRGPVVEHQRYGHVIKFTAEQVEKLRAAHSVAPAADEPITTGRKKKAS